MYINERETGNRWVEVGSLMSLKGETGRVEFQGGGKIVCMVKVMWTEGGLGGRGNQCVVPRERFSCALSM